MDDMAPLLDLVPATIPPRFVALLLLAVLAWEHVLASTEMVKANSTIRLVGDLAVAIVRRLVRRPPPAALVLVALALGGCGTIEAAPVVALALGVAAAVMLGAWMVRTARARRLEDAGDARALCSRCGALRLPTPSMVADGTVYTHRDHCSRCGEVDISDEHAQAIAHAIEAKARRRAGIPPALALALLSAWLTAPGCHLSHGTRAGLAFVAAVPTIEEGIKVYRAQRPQLERQVGIDARAACESQPSPAAYTDCSEAIAVPRWRALDDVRLSVGSYEAAVSAAASGLDNDLPAAASRVIAALASIGVRVAQEVK